MNTRNLLVSVLMLFSILFSACASAATQTQAPTTLPATSAPTTTQVSNKFTLAGDPIPEKYLDIDYFTGEGKHLTALRLRSASDTVCKELNTQGNCFTILQPNKPNDPGARGPAALVDGLIVAKFQSCPFCDGSDIGSQEYFEIQDDGGVLVGVKCETNTGAVCNADVGTTWKRLTTVSPNLFKIPISITFGPNWRYLNSSQETIELIYNEQNLFIDFLVTDHIIVLDGGNPPNRSPFPDDFADYLQSNEVWLEVTPVSPVMIGGVEGYQIDAIGKSTGSGAMSFLGFDNRAFKQFIGTSPQKFRFFFFNNVSGNQLLIVVGTDDPDLLSISQFDALLPEVQQVLDTVTFGG